MARCKDFRAWFKRNLSDYAGDIARHGADAGYPHITYNTDAAKVFDAYADEIWAMAVEDASDMGHSNVAEMIAAFGRSDMADDWLTFRVLMVWYACEKVARELSDD